MELGRGWELAAFEGVQNAGLGFLDRQLNGQGNMCLKTPGASGKWLPWKATSKKRAREPDRRGAGESGLDLPKNFPVSVDVSRNVQGRLQDTVIAANTPATKEGLPAPCQASETCHSRWDNAGVDTVPTSA